MLASLSYGQTSDDTQIKSLQIELKKSEIKRNTIELSFQLGRIYLYRPESFKKDMDSANFYFQKSYELIDSMNDFDLVNQVNYYLAETRFEQQRFKEAYEFYHKVIDYYKKNNKLEDEAKTWLKLANRTRNEIDIDNILSQQNIINYTNALTIYKQLELKVDELIVLNDIANYHFTQGRLDEAGKELLFIIEESKKIDYPNILHVYNLLSTVNRVNGDFNKSIYNGLKAVEIILQSKDSLFAPYIYRNIADSYRELGEIQQSIDWYNKALLNWETNTTIIGSEYVYRNLNYLSKQLVKLYKEEEAFNFAVRVANIMPPKNATQKSYLSSAKAAALNALGEFNLAEKEYLDAIKWLEFDPNKKKLIYLSEANLEIGEFYLNQKQYEKAKKFIIASLKVPIGIVAQAKVKDANLSLFKIDSVQGNYFQAITHFQNYKRINDSIFNVTKSRQIEELQIQYETVKKENAIKTLRSENLTKGNQLTKTTSQKNLIFGGLLLFFMVSLILYRSYIIKQRTNRILVSQKGEIAQQNTSLQELLEDKEWLLKEIHHRVKNNLQIVMSLLNTQSNYIKSNEALSAIRNSQHRLFAISLIHQKLYKTDNASLIDMNSYIKELANYLMDSFDVSDTIKFDLDIEHIMLEEAQSIPVGLILNEAITNAIKYAFAKGKKGTIAITMKKLKEKYFIAIKDNGVGLPKGFNVLTKSSLGMTLIKGLTNQLDGDFVIKEENGTLIEVVFKNKKIPDSNDHNFKDKLYR
tara:strand:- start:8246 stop:10501 length:2256 start_codon:yes stop_codon:yes gene_type:complete